MTISKLMLAVGASVGLLAAGCDMDSSTPNNTTNGNSSSTNTPGNTGRTTDTNRTTDMNRPGTTTDTTPREADNTGKNKRDADGNTKTPVDQSNAQSDLDITAAIRRAIMDDKAMSTNAQNCKIITDKGMVTLRGVVNSQVEKDAIESKAKAQPGVVRVDNQLEVKAPG